jgi:vacuolar-type H+-ATPase subunit E/Vma4
MASETSKNKVKEISDLLYKETILPAKEESERILADAREVAHSIIHKAQQEAKEIREKNSRQMSDERKIHEGSIDLAVKQALATLKSDIMNVFRKDLLTNLKTTLNEQQVLVGVVKALINGIQSQGIKCDMKLCVAKEVNFDELSDAVISSVEKKLEKGDISISSGVELVLKDKKVSLKITEHTCGELLADKLPEILKTKVFS